MYALFMLFALLVVWMQVRVLRDGRRRDWAGFTLAAAALVATQYFGLLLIAVQQLAFLAALWTRRRDRAQLRRLAVPWLVSAGALALLLAPCSRSGTRSSPPTRRPARASSRSRRRPAAP